MRTLEDRLTQASDEARLQVNQIDTRSATSIRSRQQGRRTLSGAVAVAAMFIVFGATALVLSTEVGQNSASEPSTPPTTAASVAVAEASAPAARNQELPRLGVVSDDWAVVEAVDTGNGTTLIYAGNPEVYSAAAEQPRLSIQVWSDDPGEESGSGYRHALSSLTATEEQLVDTRLNDAITARTFAYWDPNSGNLGYYFLWQHSDTVTVEVIAFVRQLDDAQAVVSSIESLAGAEWEEIQGILVDQRTDATGSTTPTTVATSGYDETEYATTTTIVADPQLPPALRGTPLTTAWGEYVVETMAMADYEMAEDEIAGMDVFEKEMDRGLVHATFTVDGNEWAIAFGPWRDGEYSDDPAMLQEQFFTEKPAQETAEGLLLISERSDPSYVYLAMDVGKIAISFQSDVVGSAVPFEDLEALALDLAPIVRQLLEADLIEWNT